MEEVDLPTAVVPPTPDPAIQEATLTIQLMATMAGITVTIIHLHLKMEIASAILYLLSY